MVLTTPLFYNLKRVIPETEIILICTKYSGSILVNNPHVDKIITFQKSLYGYLSLFFFLKMNKFDFYIDINPERSDTSKLLAKLSRAKTNIGFKNNFSGFDVHLENYIEGNHYTDISTSPIRYFNKDFKINSTPELYIPTTQSIESKPFIFINASAGKKSRILENEKYLELIRNLLQEFDLPIIVDSYTNKELKDRLLKLEIETIKSPDLNLYQLCNTIYHAKFIISPDTSVVHIASAYNKDIICMFNKVDWNIDRFYPLSDNSEVIVSDSKENLRSITPEMIMKSVKKIIGGNAGSRTRVRNEDH